MHVVQLSAAPTLKVSASQLTTPVLKLLGISPAPAVKQKAASASEYWPEPSQLLQLDDPPSPNSPGMHVEHSVFSVVVHDLDICFPAEQRSQDSHDG